MLLWDVDHTLIENGGVSKENYARAFASLVGREPVDQPRTDGRTDQTIMPSLLMANGEDPSRFAMADIFAALEQAARGNSAALARRGHAMAGAHASLRRLGSDPEVLQSALTGNIRANALVKLAAFGLDVHLDFAIGGFGEDSPVRAELVPAAQRRAQALHGFDPGQDTTVLVGDTRLDVLAGRNGGAWVMAVATGVDDAAALHEAGADVVLGSLADVDAVEAAVHQLWTRGPVGPRPAMRRDTEPDLAELIDPVR